MDKGSRWDDEISTRLEKTKVGIICLTPENLEEKWIHYEAGALSKTKEACVCTLLIDIKNPGDIEFPLAKFQATKPEKDEMLGLVRTINKLVGGCNEKSLQEEHISDAFATYWPRLEKHLKAAVQLPVTTARIERKPDDKLDEILQLLRGQDRRLSQLERAEAVTAREVTTMGELLDRNRFLSRLMQHPNITLSDLYDGSVPRTIASTAASGQALRDLASPPIPPLFDGGKD